jgi:hypothetical protein
MRHVFLAIAIIGLAACAGDDTITYQGETFHLARRYSSYDDYKNDPHNLAVQELARIRHLMVSAHVAHHYESIDELSATTGDLVFPGYGWSFAERAVIGGPTVSIEQIEIPQAGEDRVLIWVKTSHGVDVLDDFVMRGDNSSINKVEFQNGVASYFNRSGRLLSRHPLPVRDKT